MLSRRRHKWIMDNFESMLSPVPVCENDITSVQRFNVIDKLKSIDIPVLMVAGEQALSQFRPANDNG